MNKLLKFLTKYWILITTCVTIIGAIISGGLKLKGMIDSDISRLNYLESRVDEHDKDLDTQDATLDSLDHRIIPLEKMEDAREKGYCK